MKKNKLKIGDIAKELGIKKSIIRQWEQEFGLKTIDQSEHRYYSPEDMSTFLTIRDLLKVQGLSLDDAKAHLKTLPAVKYVEEVAVQAPAPVQSSPEIVIEEHIHAAPAMQQLEAQQPAALQEIAPAVPEQPLVVESAAEHDAVPTEAMQFFNDLTLLKTRLLVLQRLLN